MTSPTPRPHRGLLGVTGVAADDPIAELTVPAIMLRSGRLGWAEVVHVYQPQSPVVAFSARDLRSPGIIEATRIARSAGFEPITRSPGGRMVAYDSGAVVIDHIRTAGGGLAAADFAANARSHLSVLRAMGVQDVRIGEVDGEYCPGEFSLNVGGVAKIVGSAQRITARAGLFSTVIQVEMSRAVRAVLEQVSAALGYRLEVSSIAGLADVARSLTPLEIVDAFRADYQERLDLLPGPLPEAIVAHAAAASGSRSAELPFHVDDWARAHPL